MKIEDKALIGLAIAAVAVLFALGAWAHHQQVTYISEAKGYAPLLIFDSQETCWPSSVFFDDMDVINNAEQYVEYSDGSEIPQPSLYLHKVYRENYVVYEWWVYYARNDYANYHEHDLERIFVFVENEQPIILALSQHNWWNCYQINSQRNIYAFVERGSHATAKERWRLAVCDGLGKRIYPTDWDIIELDSLKEHENEIFTPDGFFFTDEWGDWVGSPFLREQYNNPEVALDKFPRLKELLGIT